MDTRPSIAGQDSPMPRGLPHMISYAQNFEDVLLRRVLHDVRCGYYVDVGAQDPVQDSVTKHFYDQGWSGINIEPHPAYFVALRDQRPRDTNVNLGVSDKSAMVDFHFIDGSGLSSMRSDALDVAAKHGLRGRAAKVAVDTLSHILSDHNVPEIHFMKIDIEGEEAPALRGMDFSRWRPWVLLIEGTLPCDPTPCWHEFEPIAVEGGYVPVFFDGLNRWYLRKESIDRAPLFSVPVNVFDAFTRLREHLWDTRSTKSEASVNKASFSTLYRSN